MKIAHAGIEDSNNNTGITGFNIPGFGGININISGLIMMPLLREISVVRRRQNRMNTNRLSTQNAGQRFKFGSHGLDIEVRIKNYPVPPR